MWSKPHFHLWVKVYILQLTVWGVLLNIYYYVVIAINKLRSFLSKKSFQNIQLIPKLFFKIFSKFFYLKFFFNFDIIFLYYSVCIVGYCKNNTLLVENKLANCIIYVHVWKTWFLCECLQIFFCFSRI